METKDLTAQVVTFLFQWVYNSHFVLSSHSSSSAAAGKRSVSEILLKCLNDLKSEDLKVFTWHLTEGDGYEKIPKSRLENKARCDIVSCMIDQYEKDGAGRVTLMILKKMNQNDLAKELQKELVKHTIKLIYMSVLHFYQDWCEDYNLMLLFYALQMDKSSWVTNSFYFKSALAYKIYLY